MKVSGFLYVGNNITVLLIHEMHVGSLYLSYESTLWIQ